jgi:hypothetical protein
MCCLALFTPVESAASDNTAPDRHSVTAAELRAVRAGKPTADDQPFELFLGAGYRKDTLNWNEAGSSVNIMSELKWDNLKIAQIIAAVRLDFHTDWNLRGMIAYGSIRSGTNQDSDYNGNNRTLEFSRSNNKGGGEVLDGSIGLGRTLRPAGYAGEYTLSITPIAGFSIHRQNLKMTDGFQTIPATGSFPGLNSSYAASWEGPWVGVDALVEWGGNWSLTATAEYHWAHYSANADWNLRSDFSHPVSFVHTANGRGFLLGAQSSYAADKNWWVSLAVTVQQMNTGTGIDQTFFSDGTVGFYHLNEVNWNSMACNLGIARKF